MRLLDLPLLADENIHPDLVAELVASGVNIVTVVGEGLGGRDDVEILRHAKERGRVVLTHDSDFGMLAIRRGEPFVGIVHIRPGNLPRGQVREMLDNLNRYRLLEPLSRGTGEEILDGQTCFAEEPESGPWIKLAKGC